MEKLGINLLFVIVLVAVIIKIVDGYKKGLVREVLSLISMAVLSVVIVLVANGVHNYFDGRYLNVVAAVLLLGVLGTAHHFLGLVLFPAKLVTKLPIIHFVDKLVGIVFGVLEVVAILWTVYTFIMVMDLGAIGQIILSYTGENPLLLWLYQNNYLAYWIGHILEEFNFISLI